jgi:3-hydroxyisobutyrate dehydrogenase-like beta-hydroxyacid dehydrogenase
MPRKSRKNVGLIGLGIIGLRAAAGLRAAGFHVFVWNRTPKPAPNFLGSPAEVAGLCEIIQLFVADAQALFDVIEQMSEALTSRHLIICNSTVGPEATIEAARLVEARGAAFLDAPFTGSKSAAEKRQLVYYVGGDEASCLRARPVLEATSRAIVRIGDIGHAATIKVVTNMISAVSIQTLAEALAIVQKAGLEPELLAAALEHNACRSGVMDLKLPKMISGDYEPHFSLKHMFKDVQLGIHVANALDIEIPATTVTAGVMYGALNQGCGDLDFSALFKVYESQAKPATTSLPAATPPLEDSDPEAEKHAPSAEPARALELPRMADVLNAPAEVAKPPFVLESAEAKTLQPAIIDPPKVSEIGPAPAGDEAKPESAAKPGDSPAPLITTELVSESTDTSAAKPITAMETTAGANGTAAEEAGPRPMNFVRRWFVSRGG